jgi:hypothetical protein
MTFANRNDYLTSSWVTSYYPTESVVSGTPDLCVTVSELKVPLNKYDGSQDGYLAGLISGVQSQVERFIGKDCTPRVRTAYWRYPKGTIGFSYAPVGDITEVRAIDRDGTVTVLNDTEYVIHGVEHKTITFHRPYYAIEVVYNSGYDVTPEAIRQAIIQECMFQFKNRNDPSLPARVSVNSLSLEARHLLMGYYSYAR